MNDFVDYLTNYGCHSTEPAWWNFEFPCGRGANVRLSNTPFTFDVEVDEEDGDSMDAYSEQTTEQVRKRLSELAALPADRAKVAHQVAAALSEEHL